ncbi:hypothetical protein BKA70DRAFT_1223114 [Coprinopsis sp. MPI-PUGE-AT-0042]|nr:hypothetical protein BKA70DRAFT_1223114 [Coprinopsis sp. MPI-PUGE-AT-0042]
MGGDAALGVDPRLDPGLSKLWDITQAQTWSAIEGLRRVSCGPLGCEHQRLRLRSYGKRWVESRRGSQSIGVGWLLGERRYMMPEGHFVLLSPYRLYSESAILTGFMNFLGSSCA